MKEAEISVSDDGYDTHWLSKVFCERTMFY